MTIVADESVDFGIILLLRNKGIEVYSITEKKYGIKDQEILNIAVKKGFTTILVEEFGVCLHLQELIRLKGES